MRTSLRALFFFLALASCAWGQSSLAGKWKLNTEESDDPAKKFQAAMQERMKEHGDGDHGGHHGGFGQRQSGGDHGPGGNHMSIRPESMTIEFTDPELKITDENNDTRTLYMDGRPSERSIHTPRGDAKISTTAKWQEDELDLESKMPDDSTSTQSYSLSPDKTKLFLTIRMQPMYSKDPITMHFTYDLVK
jgi:hypothetical protein